LRLSGNCTTRATRCTVPVCSAVKAIETCTKRQTHDVRHYAYAFHCANYCESCSCA